MAQIGTLHKRGAVIAYEVHAEVLGLPGGVVNRWTASLGAIARSRAGQHAPANKRPRWSHYGTPLKKSINRSKVKFHKAKGGFRLYATVGSTKHYSYFVDQGTKAHAAKILPPWAGGGYPMLWEHTWTPPGARDPLGKIWVRGIEAHEFLDKGLKDAFRAKGLSETTGAGAQMAAALRGQAAMLPDFSGSTPGGEAFKAQLDVWRAERDEAWGSADVRMSRRPKTYVRKPKRAEPTKAPTAEQTKAKNLAATLKANKNKDRAKKAADEAKAKAKKAADTIAQAKAQKARATAIRQERDNLLDQAREQYKGAGTVTVSNRMKHGGVYAFRLEVRRSSGRVVTFWITSDYQ